jgi:hypothetical protein
VIWVFLSYFWGIEVFMAQDLGALVPQILATGLDIVHKSAVMPHLVSQDVRFEPGQQGDTITVTLPMGYAQPVVPGVTHQAAAELKPMKVPVSLDYWEKAEFDLTDKELVSIVNGSIPAQLQEAAASIAYSIDRSILACYKGVWNLAGTAGQTPFQSSGATLAAHEGLRPVSEARLALNRYSVPGSDRRLVVDVDAESKAIVLPEFMKAQDSADAGVILEGQLGRKLGFDWFLNHHVNRHVTGAAGGIAVAAATAAGAEFLPIAGATAAPAVGDVFRLAGHTQGYVVLAGSTMNLLRISPTLQVGVNPGSVLSFVASHVANLAFARKAILFVNRPLVDVAPAGTSMETFVHDKSGLSLRLEIIRLNAMTKFRFDCLWAAKLVRPELACRILG